MGISDKTLEQTAGKESTQAQLIGDGSTQNVVGTQIVNVSYGAIPLEEVTKLTTSVSSQVMELALASCTQVANSVAEARMKSFEDMWIPRIIGIENAQSNLEDPKFQFMIRDANISAAQTDKKEDMKMLSELLACHIEKGRTRMIDAGIKRAIEIVPEVDPSALCGLTLEVAFHNTISNSPKINEFIKDRNDFFSSLLVSALPHGQSWIDHLSILGSVIPGVMTFYKLREYVEKNYTGFVCVGIKEDSLEYAKAIEIMKEIPDSTVQLIPHECLPGYVRLSVIDNASLDERLIRIWNMYSKDNSLKNQALNEFIKIWDSYDSLRVFHEWLDKIPVDFRVTHVGLALAQSYAQTLTQEFPDLI